jgi:hypothetical protein
MTRGRKLAAIACLAALLIGGVTALLIIRSHGDGDDDGVLGGEISADGLGDIHPGMPTEDAEAALGDKFEPSFELEECGPIETGDEDTAVSVNAGTVSIIYVFGGHSTPEGIEIGDSADDVHSAYPEGLTSEEPSFYDKGGEYLVYDPPDDGSGRLQFQIDETGTVDTIYSLLPDFTGDYPGCL